MTALGEAPGTQVELQLGIRALPAESKRGRAGAEGRGAHLCSAHPPQSQIRPRVTALLALTTWSSSCSPSDPCLEEAPGRACSTEREGCKDAELAPDGPVPTALAPFSWEPRFVSAHKDLIHCFSNQAGPQWLELSLGSGRRVLPSFQLPVLGGNMRPRGRCPEAPPKLRCWRPHSSLCTPSSGPSQPGL